MIYQRDAFNTSVVVRGNPQGEWFVMDLFIHDVHNQYWAAHISNIHN